MTMSINRMKIMVLLIILAPIFSGSARDIILLSIFTIAAWMALQHFNKIHFTLNRKTNNVVFALFIISTLLICYSIINAVVNGLSFGVLARLLQLYTAFAVLIATSQYQWRMSDYVFLQCIIRTIVLIALLLWPFSGYKTNYYAAMYGHGNGLGGVMFCCTGILLMNPSKQTLLNKLTFLSVLLLLYFSNNRSALASFLLFAFLRIVFFHFEGLRYKWLFRIVVFIFTLFPVFYMALYYSEFRSSIDAFSWFFLRKRFFSGRQYIWGEILSLIQNKLWIGYGLEVTPESISITEGLSSHSWYLQTLLQMGIIGFVLIIKCLADVWRYLYRYRNFVVCRNTSAFLLGVLLWQCFEVSITQNNFSQGILVWLILGMGINKYFIANVNEETVT